MSIQWLQSWRKPAVQQATQLMPATITAAAAAACSCLPFDISNIVFCISGSLIESLTSFITSPDFCRVPDTRSMAAQHNMAQHNTSRIGNSAHKLSLFCPGTRIRTTACIWLSCTTDMQAAVPLKHASQLLLPRCALTQCATASPVQYSPAQFSWLLAVQCLGLPLQSHPVAL